jgi:hypothetical protein
MSETVFQVAFIVDGKAVGRAVPYRVRCVALNEHGTFERDRSEPPLCEIILCRHTQRNSKNLPYFVVALNRS